MHTSRLAAAVGGLCALALGIVTLTGRTVPDQDWGTRGAVVNALGLLTFAALAVAVDALREPLALGRVGLVGLRTAQTGLVLMTVESVASEVHGGNTLGLVFVVGLLASVVGLAVVAVAGWRGSRWLSPLPLLALLVGIAAGDMGGFVVLGIVWLTLAATVLNRTAPAGSRPAVG
jgi:hypothetical protein